MIPLSYARAADADDAVRRGAAAGARYLGGGTNLVDLMRETIERPDGARRRHRPLDARSRRPRTAGC